MNDMDSSEDHSNDYKLTSKHAATACEPGRLIFCVAYCMMTMIFDCK